MMWIEALLSSLLLLALLTMTFGAPPPSLALAQFAAYQSLDDHAAALAEISSRRTMGAPIDTPFTMDPLALQSIFSDSNSFCYRYKWDAQPPAFSPHCDESAFHSPPSVRSVKIGAWVDHQLRFLTMEQTMRP